MFTQPLELIFFGVGLLTIILNRFYINSKYWYWFIIFAVVSIYSAFKVKNVIVLENDKVYREYSTFYSTYSYKFKNGNFKNLEITDNTLINNSDYSVIIEKVFYSTNGGVTEENPIVTTIYPYSINNSLPKIDYIFRDPPQRISEKGGGDTKTTYWLHY